MTKFSPFSTEHLRGFFEIPLHLRLAQWIGGDALKRYHDEQIRARIEEMRRETAQFHFEKGKKVSRDESYIAMMSKILRIDTFVGAMMQNSTLRPEDLNGLRLELRSQAEYFGVSLGQVVLNEELKAPIELRAGHNTVFDPYLYEVHPFFEGQVRDGDLCMITTTLVTHRQGGRDIPSLKGIVALQDTDLTTVPFILPTLLRQNPIA